MLYMEDDGKPMDLGDFDDLKGENDDRPSNCSSTFFSDAQFTVFVSLADRSMA